MYRWGLVGVVRRYMDFLIILLSLLHLEKALFLPTSTLFFHIFFGKKVKHNQW